MNIDKEQAIAWAREVYGYDEGKAFHESALLHLERFAALAYAAGAAAENEACAKPLEEAAKRLTSGTRYNQIDLHVADVLKRHANAIRARREK